MNTDAHTPLEIAAPTPASPVTLPTSRDAASTTLPGAIEYRAYVGAKFADEPTEGDHLSSHFDLTAAQQAVEQARRGGHGFVWEPAGRRLWAHAGSGWKELPVEGRP